MARILVVGTSGSGKTTVSQLIATRLNLNHVASDEFYWQFGWNPSSIEHVDRLLDEVLGKPSWILDGNFEHRWEDIWNRADLIVWLDYSLPTVLWQVSNRNIAWFFSRRPAWSGNRMTLKRAMSGIRHSFRSHRRKRNAYPHYIAQLRQTNVIRISSRRQLHAWIVSLDAKYEINKGDRRPLVPPILGDRNCPSPSNRS